MTDETADLLREVLFHTMAAEMAALRAERILGLDDATPPGELRTADAFEAVAFDLRTPEDAFSLSPERLAEVFRLPTGAT